MIVLCQEFKQKRIDFASPNECQIIDNWVKQKQMMSQLIMFTPFSALNEIGHGLFKLREQGWKPRRTIVMASWGAEVYNQESTYFPDEMISCNSN